jgi:hypothetical protein
LHSLDRQGGVNAHAPTLWQAARQIGETPANTGVGCSAPYFSLATETKLLIFYGLNTPVELFELAVFLCQLTIGKTAALLDRMPLLHELAEFGAQLRILVFSGSHHPLGVLLCVSRLL